MVYFWTQLEIAIIDHNWSGAPLGLIQGNYTVVLMSGTYTNTRDGVDVALSQTSLVPVGTKSLQFKAYKGFDPSGIFAVTLGGQTLPLAALGTGVNYTLYGADATQWAG